MSSISLNQIPNSQASALDPFAKHELNELEKEACMCKTATKVAGCLCLPVSCLCYLGYYLSCIVTLDDTYKHPERDIEYSKWTTCDGKCCWLPKLPPKDKCEQVWQIFDPCVFCICCDKGISANYLPPEKQKCWIDLKQKTNCKESMDELKPPFRRFSPLPDAFRPSFHGGPQGASGWY